MELRRSPSFLPPGTSLEDMKGVVKIYQYLKGLEVSTKDNIALKKQEVE